MLLARGLGLTFTTPGKVRALQDDDGDLHEKIYDVAVSGAGRYGDAIARSRVYFANLLHALVR